ncbi:MAG: hypothetical protein FWG85_01655 [Bacteroidetes bacterium]|nr:hypothetical protein [Bacteroidota bacterium]
MKQKSIIKIVLFVTLILMFNSANAQNRYQLYCSHLLLETSYIVALEQVGTLEKSNKNDGDVVKYLKLFGFKSGTPYCAAGQYYCFYEGAKRENISTDSIPIIKSALCLDIYNDAKKRGNKTKYSAQKHDLIIWKKPKSWQGHIERIHNVLPNGWVETIGFNSSKTINGKKQEGVFLQRRNILHPLGRLKVKGIVGFHDE